MTAQARRLPSSASLHIKVLSIRTLTLPNMTFSRLPGHLGTPLSFPRTGESWIVVNPARLRERIGDYLLFSWDPHPIIKQKFKKRIPLEVKCTDIH